MVMRTEWEPNVNLEYTLQFFFTDSFHLGFFSHDYFLMLQDLKISVGETFTKLRNALQIEIAFFLSHNNLILGINSNNRTSTGILVGWQKNLIQLLSEEPVYTDILEWILTSYQFSEFWIQHLDGKKDTGCNYNAVIAVS